MKKILAVLAAGSALAAVPAFAQDASTFTGPRIEGIVGYDISQAGSSVDNDTTRDDDQSIDGVMYGVGIGYDVAVGSNAIIGVEGEFTDSQAKTTFNDGDFEGFGLGTVETGRDLYVGARAGILMSPSTLLYVKGGYTNARYNVLGSDGTTEVRQNIDTDGWRAGAGAEFALNSNTFAKLEYRYSNYSEGEVDFDGAGADSPRFDIDTDRHQVVAAVGVRF